MSVQFESITLIKIDYFSDTKRKMRFAVSLLTLLHLICAINSHRILGLFPHPGLSHFNFFHPIMRALAEAGHEVTVVSQFSNNPPMENYKDELLSEVNNGLVNAVSLDVKTQQLQNDKKFN